MMNTQMELELDIKQTILLQVQLQTGWIFLPFLQHIV